jgi:hypothetical protein
MILYMLIHYPETRWLIGVLFMCFLLLQYPHWRFMLIGR